MPVNRIEAYLSQQESRIEARRSLQAYLHAEPDNWPGACMYDMPDHICASILGGCAAREQWASAYARHFDEGKCALGLEGLDGRPDIHALATVTRGLDLVQTLPALRSCIELTLNVETSPYWHYWKKNGLYLGGTLLAAAFATDSQFLAERVLGKQWAPGGGDLASWDDCTRAWTKNSAENARFAFWRSYWLVPQPKAPLRRILGHCVALFDQRQMAAGLFLIDYVAFQQALAPELGLAEVLVELTGVEPVQWTP